MSNHLIEAITGALAVTSAWIVVSVPLALVLGRIMRARELNEIRGR